MAQPRDVVLELLDWCAEDEQLVIDYPHHLADDFVLDEGVLGAEI
jgi:hypothetical protein